MFNIIKTLVLAAGGQGSDVINEGELLIEPGYKCRGLRLRFYGNVSNSSAGTTTFSTTAQKLALLNTFQTTFKHGPKQAYQPWINEIGSMIRECSREIAGIEVDQFSDATVGLGTTLNGSGTNGGLTAIEFTLYLPLGRNWKIEDDGYNFGMGVYQMRTAILKVKRLADVAGFPANITSSGTWNCDVYADCIPNEGHDVLYFPPEMTTQLPVADFTKTLDDGLHWFVLEQTAPHASTTITQADVYIGDDQYMDAFPLRPNYLNALNDEVPFSGAPQITDTDTVLFRQRYDEPVDHLHVGAFRIVQPHRDLNPMLLRTYYQPVRSETQINEYIQYLTDSKLVKASKALKIVAGHTLLPSHVGLPEKLIPFAEIGIIEKGQGLFDTLPGITAAPGGGQPQVTIPAIVTKVAQAQIGAHVQNGSHGGAGTVAKRLALGIPGAVQHSSGIGNAPSSAVATIAAHIGSSVPVKQRNNKRRPTNS